MGQGRDAFGQRPVAGLYLAAVDFQQIGKAAGDIWHASISGTFRTARSDALRAASRVRPKYSGDRPFQSALPWEKPQERRHDRQLDRD